MSKREKSTAHLVRQQINGDCSSDDLLHVSSDDCDFIHDPQQQTRKCSIFLIAQFGQMKSSHDSQSKNHLNFDILAKLARLS